MFSCSTVSRDRVEGLHQLAIDRLRLLEALALHDLAEGMLQRAAHIAGIAGRGAMARLLRLEHRHLPPAAREVNRCGKAGDAGADDRHVGFRRRGGVLALLARGGAPPEGIEGGAGAQDLAAECHDVRGAIPQNRASCPCPSPSAMERAMRFTSGKDFANRPQKAVTIFGMSGVGKTTLSNLLQDSGWYHYSVDYRIGTRYMGEHIVDNFKREAMRVPFLRDLLLSDSIHIQSNITFDNLEPLSTYLGKPGNPEKGGISFAEYQNRQNQHREAEIAALLDVPGFIGKARDIYQYGNFVCDSGGSLCEVVDPSNPLDPVLSCLAENTLLLYIEGTPEHTRDAGRALPQGARSPCTTSPASSRRNGRSTRR